MSAGRQQHEYGQHQHMSRDMSTTIPERLTRLPATRMSAAAYAPMMSSAKSQNTEATHHVQMICLVNANVAGYETDSAVVVNRGNE